VLVWALENDCPEHPSEYTPRTLRYLEDHGVLHHAHNTCLECRARLPCVLDHSVGVAETVMGFAPCKNTANMIAGYTCGRDRM